MSYHLGQGALQQAQIQVAIVFGVNTILLLPNNLEKDNHLRPSFWICLRCLEHVEHIMPNGGLIMIYHGTR